MSLTCRCHRSRGTPGTFDHFDMPPRRCRTSVNPISRSFFTPSGDRTACSQMTTVGADGERPRSLSLFSNEARPGSTGQRFAPRKWCFRYSNAHRTSTICVSEAERTASMPSTSSSCVRNPGSHQGVLRFGCRLPLLVGRDLENAIKRLSFAWITSYSAACSDPITQLGDCCRRESARPLRDFRIHGSMLLYVRNVRRPRRFY